MIEDERNTIIQYCKQYKRKIVERQWERERGLKENMVKLLHLIRHCKGKRERERERERFYFGETGRKKGG